MDQGSSLGEEFRMPRERLARLSDRRHRRGLVHPLEGVLSLTVLGLKNITFCADGGCRLPALRFVSRPDTAWIGQGVAFGPPTAQRRCTLLVVWYAEQEEPWIILTDLPPKEVGVSWYALRFYI